MIGKQILHYNVLEELGRGGMGVVYKAEDTKLKRDVAIKFLPSQIAANEEEHERFKIEAQAAAALNHPNIATIYTIEDVDEELFIVMEYIEGQELKDVIDNQRSTIEDVKNYATQIAEGLQAAHQKGIVHRDIKSANIMITKDGKVKIMDFGLAKVAGGVQLTKDQSTLGTTAYMSPEQGRGEVADQRSDIWSLGVVLYEMFTGELPFKGDYEQAVIYAILNENPESITAFRSGIPEELERIVHKCLEKTPAKRYQHLDELFADLNALSKQSEFGTSKKPGTHIKPDTRKRQYRYAILFTLVAILLLIIYFWPGKEDGIDAIAVLPLQNISGDPERALLTALPSL